MWRALPLLAAAVAGRAAARSAAAAHITISNAANVTKCLGVDDRSLVLQDCLESVGAQWNWTVVAGGRGGRLALTGYAAVTLAAQRQQCLDSHLKVKPCEHVNTEWRWDQETLQIQMDGGGRRWCLGLIGIELLLDTCDNVSGTATDTQNGYGARAEQTWILLPTDRPQIRILDRLKFPLRAAGQHIVDSVGRRVKLVGVNWGGAHTEQLVCSGLTTAPLKSIAKAVKYMGFNVVRLGYASQLHRLDGYGEMPRVPSAQALLKANPELKGLSALEIFERTVKVLTDEGLLVILSRRMGTAGKCCSGNDGSELWYGGDYTEDNWHASLAFMARRFKHNPRVIGIDILNEPRVRETDSTIAWWGFPSAWSPLTRLFGFELADWRVAAARGALAVWEANPDALVLIEGQLYATDLERVQQRPLKLAQECLASRIVYSTHEYRWLWTLHEVGRGFSWVLWPFNFGSRILSAARGAAKAVAEDRAGMATGQGADPRSYDVWAAERNREAYYLHRDGGAPVWVSEFGTNLRRGNPWWDYMLHYLNETDLGWCYGSLEAEQAGDVDTYGLFDASRNDYAAVVGWKLQDLVGIQAPKSGRPEKVAAAQVPGVCALDLEANRRAASEGTQVVEYVKVMAKDWQAAICAVLWGSLLLLLPCMICITRLQRACKPEASKGVLGLSDEETEAGGNAPRREGLKAWHHQRRETEYYSVHHAPDGKVMVTPMLRPDARLGSSLASGLFCCSSSSSDRFASFQYAAGRGR